MHQEPLDFDAVLFHCGSRDFPYTVWLDRPNSLVKSVLYLTALNSEYNFSTRFCCKAPRIYHQGLIMTVKDLFNNIVLQINPCSQF